MLHMFVLVTEDIALFVFGAAMLAWQFGQYTQVSAQWLWWWLLLTSPSHKQAES